MDVFISANASILGLMLSYTEHEISIKDVMSVLKEADKHPCVSVSRNLRKCKFKQSRYNYSVQTKSGYVVYNTLYNSLVRMRPSEYDQFVGTSKCSESFMEELQRNGFWINSDVDELKRYTDCAELLMKAKNQHLSITVATTLKCNAKCPYCYERGVMQVDMPKENVGKLVSFIKNSGPDPVVEFTWFGGEPLMNTDFIDAVCEEVASRQIKFSSFMITNGSLFHADELDRQIADWHLESVQISLDGTYKMYQKTKQFSPDSYYFVLDNVCQLMKQKIRVVIRLNVTHDNADNILVLIKELDYLFSGNDYIRYYPAFIEGTANAFKPEEKICYLSKLVSVVKDLNQFTIIDRLYSLPKTHSCHATNPRAFTIDVCGNIMGCEHYVGRTERAFANLDNISEIIDPRLQGRPLRLQCRECVFLPKCFGGCYAYLEAGLDPCRIEKYLIPSYLQSL